MPGWYTRTGDSLIQWGWELKEGFDLRISFPAVFATIPAVVVTPEWPTDWVRSIETVRHIDGGGFNTYCENHADNYYVDWIAIGRPQAATLASGETPDAATATKVVQAPNPDQAKAAGQ